MAENETVTDDQLDAAAEEGEASSEESVEDTQEEEQAEEQQVEEEIPEEPEDNADRSKLGRKVKELAESQTDFFNKMSLLLNTKLSEKDIEPEPEFEFDGVPTTPEELDQWYENKKSQEKKAKEKYEGSYISVIDMEKGKTTPELHAAVYKEMMENFNIRYSDNGASDARLNYMSAKAAYLEKAMTAKKNPLEKNKDKDLKNLGGGSDTSVKTGKSSQTVVLDKYAQEFINKVGMSEEDAQASLNKPIPSYLGVVGG